MLYHCSIHRGEVGVDDWAVLKFELYSCLDSVRYQ